MKYKLDLATGLDFSSPPASGAQTYKSAPGFMAWQPSTWPAAPSKVDETFILTLKQIFEESILREIANVISDAKKCNGDLTHRGHVVAISLMCALDAISSYGYRGRKGNHIRKFISNHFTAAYHPYGIKLYKLYRNSLIHKWNLFEATIYPGDEVIVENNGTLSFGLLNFFDCLVNAVGDFLEELATNAHLQANTLRCYDKLKNSAKS